MGRWEKASFISGQESFKLKDDVLSDVGVIVAETEEIVIIANH